MDMKCDVAIIGAGTAGLSALSQVRGSGSSFVLVDRGPLGTTCARVGCMPSKTLIETAAALHARELLAEVGIRGADSLPADTKKVMAWVRDRRDGFVQSTLRATADMGDRLVRGTARFLEPGLLEVEGRRIEAGSVIVATGSEPVVPAPWRELGDRLLTSDDLFEMDDLPESMAVVGLGPLGLEMAQALARLGVRVRGFDASGSIGGIEDPAVAEAAARIIGGELPMRLGAQVKLSPVADGVEVTVEGETERFDAVLASVGRRPTLDDLGLDVLGVPLDDRGVPEHDPATLRVGGLPVFIAGDANGREPLLHVASDDGRIAGWNALAAEPDAFVRRVPMSVVFTRPGIASVGSVPAGEDDRGVLVGEADMRGQGRAAMTGADSGLVRVFASAEDGMLSGAALVAPGAEHMAHLLALGLTGRLTVRDMLRAPYYHPTVEEGLRSALRGLASKLSPGSGGPLRPEMAFAGRDAGAGGHGAGG